MTTGLSSFLLLLAVLIVGNCAKSFPGEEIEVSVSTSQDAGHPGRRQNNKLLTPQIDGYSSSRRNRLLAELFGEVDLGVSLGRNEKVAIHLGGAATRCQHQSPCFDSRCKLCYDPLLRIHGRCGGASYFTCRGTLPKGCLPFTCSARAGRSLDGSSAPTAVFVKRFPRFQDPYCLAAGGGERGAKEGRSLIEGEDEKSSSAVSDLTYHPRDENDDDEVDAQEEEEMPPWAFTVPDAVTPCQGFDLCVDERCGRCYDPYLGSHVGCGQMSHYECGRGLPRECRPMQCTGNAVKELFEEASQRQRREEGDPTAAEEDETTEQRLYIRDFAPVAEGNRNCV